VKLLKNINNLNNSTFLKINRLLYSAIVIEDVKRGRNIEDIFRLEGTLFFKVYKTSFNI
jgi:hypothetical protein